MGRRETVSRQPGSPAARNPGTPSKDGGQGAAGRRPPGLGFGVCEVSLRGSHIDPKTSASFKE